MEGNNASTMGTREFLARLAEGHFDGGGIAAVVSTSYADDAAAARSVVSDRGLADSVLVLAYDDVENPKRPTAFSGDMAADAAGFFERTVADEWVFVCDGVCSRSAAVMCAWVRLYGGGDFDYWADPERYAPNVLVYRRILVAVGRGLTDEQAGRLSKLKEAVLERKIKKAGNARNTGGPESRGAFKLAERQKRFVKALGELGSAGITELVEAMGIPTASVYNTLKSLEEAGLVERAPDRSRRLSCRGIFTYREISDNAAIAAPVDMECFYPTEYQRGKNAVAIYIELPEGNYPGQGKPIDFGRPQIPRGDDGRGGSEEPASDADEENVSGDGSVGRCCKHGASGLSVEEEAGR